MPMPMVGWEGVVETMQAHGFLGVMGVDGRGGHCFAMRSRQLSSCTAAEDPPSLSFLPLLFSFVPLFSRRADTELVGRPQGLGRIFPTCSRLALAWVGFFSFLGVSTLGFTLFR